MLFTDIVKSCARHFGKGGSNIVPFTKCDTTATMCQATFDNQRNAALLIDDCSPNGGTVITATKWAAGDDVRLPTPMAG